MVDFILISLLVLCFIQDVKFRGVHWIVFPLILGGTFYLNFEIFVWNDLILNFFFLLFMMLMLTLYLSIKLKKLILITKGFFSLGDILFLLAVIPLFTFQEYVYFYTIGTVLSLLFHFIANRIRKQETVPYAGYMSIVTILFIIFREQLQTFLIQA